ncbi:MAG: hypothetical protein ACRCX2_35320 [Paraclostridium sp.]
MLVSLFLKRLIDFYEKQNQDSQQESKERPEIVSFSTDIDKVQGECFDNGIMGFCGSECKLYGSSECEL